MVKRKFKVKPNYGNAKDIAFLRKKLTELVTRMKRDYAVELKPLIKRLEEESSKEKAEAIEKAEKILKGDSIKFLTPYEASRIAHCLKSEIINSCETGKIEGCVKSGGEWLVPEESAYRYGVDTGRIKDDRSLLSRFFDKVEELKKKYDDMSSRFQNFVTEFTTRTFADSKRKFYRQFGDFVGIDIMRALSERGLKEEFDLQVKDSVNLIKTLPSKYFDRIQELVTQSISGDRVFEHGLIAELQDLTKTTRNRAKLIARDQSAKAVSSVNAIRYQNLGCKRYIWHNEQDQRVAGNPNGLYPHANDKSKYHGNHWKREGKIFSWDNPPPDGNPGMPINCRCYAEPIFDEEEMR